MENNTVSVNECKSTEKSETNSLAKCKSCKTIMKIALTLEKESDRKKIVETIADCNSCREMTTSITEENELVNELPDKIEKDLIDQCKSSKEVKDIIQCNMSKKQKLDSTENTFSNKKIKIDLTKDFKTIEKSKLDSTKGYSTELKEDEKNSGSMMVSDSVEEYNSNEKLTNIESSSVVNFNPNYEEKQFIQTLSEAFLTKKSHLFENGARILGQPFTCCELPNFLKPEEFVSKLKGEIEELEVEVCLNDLYQFKQSKDLGTSSVPEISTLKTFLRGKCREWLKEVTSIDLTDKVDMFCSCYTYTDHLLCHDDELEGRRIAYIYYLVPEWEEKCGGLLDLFNTADNEPTDICTSLLPTWNKLIFFEVSPSSYHQVSEILAFRTRTSISGWFYGPPLPPVVRRNEPIPFSFPKKDLTIDVKEWINPTYLHPDTQQDIRESFEDSSEMELIDFLEKSKFDEVCKALKSEVVKWKLVGPPNKRRFEELLQSPKIPPIIQECRDLFCSESFLEVLCHLTGLKLHPTVEQQCGMGQVNCSIRRWQRGSYTLLHEHAFLDYATLNTALGFNWPDWDVEYGGYTSYVAQDEKEELLRVDPKLNSLALVYITEGTSHFVKYINSRCPSDSYFYDIFAMYKESE